MKPILFNTEMTVATMDDRKTATRRLVKPQPVFREGETGTPVRCDDGSWCFKIDQYHEVYDFELKPPYQTGDVLYVRETWKVKSASYPPRRCEIEYKAGGTEKFDEVLALPTAKGEWKPSIHMPKKAARTFLRVTDVRLERLQDMDGEQAYMEGARAEVPPILEALESGDKSIFPKNFEKFSANKKEDWYRGTATATYIAQCELSERLLKAFKNIWNKTIKPEDTSTYGWDANPWVWVIEFQRIGKREALKEG